jgi:hypothetical protein
MSGPINLQPKIMLKNMVLLWNCKEMVIISYLIIIFDRINYYHLLDSK